MNWFRKVAAIALAVLAFEVFVCAEPIAQLSPSNYVNDFAGALDAATVTHLNDVAKQIDEKAHAQIAVVIVKSTDDQDITSYAVALYQKWGIGKKGSDRGVLILLAVQDRHYWTTVGYGLEPILPDGKVGGFGREAVPLLKKGDYAGAASLMTLRVANVIAQDAGITLENAQAPQPEPVAAPHAGPGVFVLIVIAVLVVWALSRAGRGGGGGSGFLSGLLWSLLFSSMSGRGGGGGSGGGSWGGGGFGGGGGGFGGFGGGSTGGGGSGGSW